jgi:copper homeostasis protein
MEDDIAHVRDLGVNGVTLGVLDEQAHVDLARTARLVRKAEPLPVTFHRAIDMTPEPSAEINAVVESGAKRVLTSGGSASALQGLEEIARMQEAAKGRIRLMAGGGITAQTVARVAHATRATEFHASLRSHWPSPVHYRRENVLLGETHVREYLRHGVREEEVRALVAALQRLEEEPALAPLAPEVRP